MYSQVSKIVVISSYYISQYLKVYIYLAIKDILELIINKIRGVIYTFTIAYFRLKRSSTVVEQLDLINIDFILISYKAYFNYRVALRAYILLYQLDKRLITIYFEAFQRQFKVYNRQGVYRQPQQIRQLIEVRS